VAAFLLVIIKLFAISYGRDVISRYWSKSAFFKGGGVTLSANFGWKGYSPPTSVGIKKLVIALSCGIIISAVCSFFSSLTGI